MIRLPEAKHRTEARPIERAPLPKLVSLPLSQHLGKMCSSLVKSGDEVLRAQKIASIEAHVSAPVHASLSGRVRAVADSPHPVLGKCKAVIIESDGKDACIPLTQRSSEAAGKLTPDEIRKIVFEAGIVGMGGATFPTHVKLAPPRAVDTLIINGAECEPCLTSDSRLMVEKTKEVLLGIELISRCLGAKQVYVAIEDNKPEAIGAFRAGEGKGYEVRTLRSSYPQGGEKQLIRNVLRKEVPSGKLPFDIGVVVQNVATVFAVYEAVYLSKPLYERVVTVTGSCLKNPRNLLVRMGTPIRELIDFCGPLVEEPAKIIIGGPMMGIAQYSDEVPVIKSTGGVVLFNSREAGALEEEFCIRCGACVRECPSGLMPCLINLASDKELWARAKEHGALDCIECGVCSYVCPANRRLVQSIKRAKTELSRK